MYSRGALHALSLSQTGVPGRVHRTAKTPSCAVRGSPATTCFTWVHLQHARAPQ